MSDYLSKKTRLGRIWRPDPVQSEYDEVEPHFHKQTSRTSTRVLLGLCLLLGEHSDAEVSVEVRFKGGRDDQVFSRRQFEARADLTQIDEGLWPRRLSVGQEEVLIQVHLPLPLELKIANQDIFQPPCRSYSQ